MRRHYKLLISIIKKSLLIFLPALIILVGGFFNVKEAKAASASLFLAPASGTYVINGKFSVAVKVNTGGEVVNAAEGIISFDNNLLEVAGVSKSGSIFPFWTTEPSFSNSGGTISFGGGLPPPAYSGTAGHIMTISFKAKKSGGAQVRFASGAVLANDGKGTNILASMGSGSYTISPKVTTPQPSTETSKPQETVEAEYNKPVITSPTHSDPNKWYNKTTVEFKWELPEGVTGVSIVFDENPVADPGPSSDGLFSEKTYEDVGDGIWYLHLKFKDSKRWGTVGHFRVMVDTASPLPFEIRVEQPDKEDWPELLFEATDKDSGLDKYFIYLGSLEKQAHEAGPETKTFKVSGLGAGEHIVMMKAVDKAGNERLSSVHFNIEPIKAPVIKNCPSEIKSSDKFFVSGIASPDGKVNIYIEKDNNLIFTASTTSNSEGNWFYISDKSFDNGRYVVWVEAENKNGLKSGPSEKVSFLVSPPVFAVIGSFVINYFTVFVSLIFMIILIVLLILYIAGLVRRKLKKETLEVEEIIHKNALAMKKAIDQEFMALAKFEGKAGYKKEKEKTKSNLKKTVDTNEKKSIKEVKDVEEILK